MTGIVNDLTSTFEIVRRLCGDKWKFLIICYLFNGPKRYGELQYHLDSIKPKVLTENLKELENLNCILNLENTKATQQLKEILKKSNISIHADMMCDATEIRVEAVKRNMGIAYVKKEAVKKELNNKELYEVELPIKLPNIKLNLIYLSGELTKIDKKFIKEYLK